MTIERAGSMDRKVAIFATNGNSQCSEYGDIQAVATSATIRGMTIPDLVAWARDALKKSGMKQAELGRAIDPYLPGNYADRSKLNKFFNEDRDLSAAEMLAIEAVTGHPIPGRVPARPDSFWPLFEELEKLDGEYRHRAYLVVKSLTESFSERSG